MGFKINQEVAEQPKYCDYIQEKVDIAQKNNASYELTDEDNRIQALYDDENLLTKDVIRIINRVKVNEEDGKEYITVNKNVDFFTRDPKDANKLGDYKDRYIRTEGLVEIPIRSNTSSSTTASSEAATPTKVEYTIPFTKENVDKYAKNTNEGITYRFYEGSKSSNRTPTVIPSVTNLDYFRDATWDELLLGREKKVLNSMINRLPEVRKEFNSNSNSGASSTEQTTTKEEVNKQQKVKEEYREEDEEVSQRQEQIIEPSKHEKPQSTTATIEPLNNNKQFSSGSKQGRNNSSNK